MKRFELLIVDNEPAKIEALEVSLLHSLGNNLSIFSATSINDGKRLILERKAWLNAAILDFHFPTAAGGWVIDESLCHLLRDNAPHVPVFHYTGFRDHEQVLRHVWSCHAGPAYVFPTLDPETGIYPAVIRRLWSDRAGGLADLLQAGGANGRSGDLFLAALELFWIAVEQWDFLDEIVRRKVRCYRRSCDGAPVSFSLIDANRAELPLGRLEEVGAFTLRFCEFGEASRGTYPDAVHPDLVKYYGDILRRSKWIPTPHGCPIKVFVKEVSDLIYRYNESICDLGADGYPYILLPVLWDWNRAQAALFVAREVSRAKSMTEFFGKRPPPKWWWLIEGTADLDSKVMLRTTNLVQIIQPQNMASIDNVDKANDSWIFIDYLRKRFLIEHPDIVSEILALANVCPDPWTAMELVLGENFDDGLPFFANFARDSYLRSDPRSILADWHDGHFPDSILYAKADSDVQHQFDLDHLSRHYLQVSLPGDVNDEFSTSFLHVEIKCDHPHAARFISAEMLQCVDGGIRQRYHPYAIDAALTTGTAGWKFVVSIGEALAGVEDKAATLDLIILNAAIAEQYDNIPVFVSAVIFLTQGATG